MPYRMAETNAAALNGRSHRRRSFKFPSKTPYQSKNAVKCGIFRYMCNKVLHILSNFCRTFCVRNSTDCAREFAV